MQITVQRLGKRRLTSKIVASGTSNATQRDTLNNLIGFSFVNEMNRETTEFYAVTMNPDEATRLIESLQSGLVRLADMRKEFNIS